MTKPSDKTSNCSPKTSTNDTCAVCSDKSSGFHYGVYACEGCKGFFRRCLVQGTAHLTCQHQNACVINQTTRNSCQSCRHKKCVSVGMSKNASKLGRRPKRKSNENDSPDSSGDSKKLLVDCKADTKPEAQSCEDSAICSNEGQQPSSESENAASRDQERPLPDELSTVPVHGLIPTNHENSSVFIPDIISNNIDPLTTLLCTPDDYAFNSTGFSTLFSPSYIDHVLFDCSLVDDKLAEVSIMTIIQLYFDTSDVTYASVNEVLPEVFQHPPQSIFLIFKHLMTYCPAELKRSIKFCLFAPYISSIAKDDCRLMLRLSLFKVFLLRAIPLVVQNPNDPEAGYFFLDPFRRYYCSRATLESLPCMGIMMGRIFDIAAEWRNLGLLEEDLAVFQAFVFACSENQDLRQKQGIREVELIYTKILMRRLTITWGVQHATALFRRLVTRLLVILQDLSFLHYKLLCNLPNGIVNFMIPHYDSPWSQSPSSSVESPINESKNSARGVAFAPINPAASAAVRSRINEEGCNVVDTSAAASVRYHQMCLDAFGALQRGSYSS